MSIRIVVIQGEQKGATLDLPEDREVVLGRKSDCDLFLQDDLLSRYHCRLSFDGNGDLSIEDMQSRNGTYLNGVLLEKRSFLKRGDFISIGSHLLRCLNQNDPWEVPANQVLCTRCGTVVPYPQPEPPYICYTCYKKYFQEDQQAAPPMRKFGPYEVHSLLGEGGVSSVYLALDTRTQKTIALKLLKTNSEAYIRRFEREESIYRKLFHPNIIHLYDSGSVEDTLYIAMEYITGENLHEYVCRLGILSDAEALNIIHDISQGVANAHHLGVIHRDIKPGNIMISSEKGVKVLDFGLAKSLESHSFDGLTKAGSGLGSLMYVSPEQLVNAKDVDERTDIYSLGATLYFMKTFSHPFSADTPAETMMKIRQGDLDWTRLPASSHPGIEKILRCCLQVEPQNRYRTAEELIQSIENVQKSLS